MTGPATLQALRCRAVQVPLKRPLGTSAAVVRAAPLVLLDLTTSDGVVGRSYLFAYRSGGARAIAALLADAFELVRGQPAEPMAVAALLERRLALIGVTGVARMALSALDIAIWDGRAVAAGQPLARLLGGSLRPLRAYNSAGLGLIGAAAAADEACALLDGGFGAVKLRLGYASAAEDLAVTRAVRARLPDAVQLMVDYNQALDRAQALERGRALDGEGVAWLEEPVRHDDWAANAEIARTLALPLQLGENFNGPAQMLQALEASACDLVMPDLGRIGGVSGWMQAAALAAARGLPMSSHLMPEQSAHLLLATPTADWLEHVDWADALLQRPLRVIDGTVQLADEPGSGLAWDESAVARFALD
ncbi:MAG: enolase C-terminal domain-like protein [Rubrivivax sp.]